jgi:hypothetical protein
MSAEALFDSFPKTIRESLGDVPGALRALEAQAAGARARIAELDATVAEATRAPPRRFRSARGSARCGPPRGARDRRATSRGRG